MASAVRLQAHKNRTASAISPNIGQKIYYGTVG
jgi:hypothetical protein